jgi:hypothetical protein
MKAPWYGTTSILILLLGIGLLLFTTALVGWAIAALVRLRPRHPSPLISRLGRWTGVSFAVVLVSFLSGWAFLLLDIDPAYATQEIAFGPTPLFYALSWLAYILVGLGILMLIFAFLSWMRRLGSLSGRLHYILLALSALSLVWALGYWNLLS